VTSVKSDPATKADIELAVSELRSEMGEIRSDVNGLRSGMDGLRSDMADIGKRIEEQGKTLSAELARHSSAIRDEVRTWFVVLDDKHTALNDAVRSEQQELRKNFDDHRADATVHRLPRKPRTG